MFRRFPPACLSLSPRENGERQRERRELTQLIDSNSAVSPPHSRPRSGFTSTLPLGSALMEPDKETAEKPSACGCRGKPGPGRPKGTPNKATANARAAIGRFVDENSERLQEWLDEIAEKEGPKVAWDCFWDAVEYHVPKLTRSDMRHTFAPAASTEAPAVTDAAVLAALWVPPPAPPPALPHQHPAEGTAAAFRLQPAREPAPAVPPPPEAPDDVRAEALEAQPDGKGAWSVPPRPAPQQWGVVIGQEPWRATAALKPVMPIPTGAELRAQLAASKAKLEEQS
jgi:hypothetical protein